MRLRPSHTTVRTGPYTAVRWIYAVKPSERGASPSLGRRAFGVDTRHAHFGPFSTGVPGFTLRHRRQGQFHLDFLPHGTHERIVLLVLSIVRAFAGRPATMPSADFCAAITALTLPLSPDFPDTTQTSRGKTDRLHRIPAAFTTPALDGCGLRDHWLARPAG